MDDLDALLRTLEIFTHLVYIPDKLIDKVKHSCAKSDLEIQRLLTSALEIDDDPDEYGATVSSILTCIGQLTLHLLEYALYTMDWISKFNPAHVHEEYIHGLCGEAEEFARRKVTKVFTVLRPDDELAREFFEELRREVVLMREKEILLAREQYQSSLLRTGGTISLGEEVDVDLPEDASSQRKNMPTGSNDQPLSTPKGELPPERVARKTAVDSFLSRCEAETGILVTKSHIWRAAGRTSARQFQYWVNSHKKASRRDNLEFSRMLNMEPADFLALLREKGIVAKDKK